MFFKKLVNFFVKPIKALWNLITAPFRNRYIGYAVVGTTLGVAWAYKAITNPSSFWIEMIAISCMTSVIARLIKIKGDGFGADLINALTGACAFAVSFFTWMRMRELSLIFGLIFIPFALIDIDRKYLQYTGARS